MNPTVKLELNTIGELEILKVRVARCDERWMDVVFRRRHGLRNAAVETVRADYAKYAKAAKAANIRAE